MRWNGLEAGRGGGVRVTGRERERASGDHVESEGMAVRWATKPAILPTPTYPVIRTNMGPECRQIMIIGWGSNSH